MTNQLNLHIYRNDGLNDSKTIKIDRSTAFEKLL